MSKLNSKTTERTKVSITVADHPTFEGDMKSNIISSIDMAEIVSSLFAPAFADYYGCNIRVNDGHTNPVIASTMPIGAIYVDLYFKDFGNAPEGTQKNIVSRNADKDKSGDLGARFMRVNGAFNNSRAYTVTKETYEALEDFAFNQGRTRWNEHTQEITTSMSTYGKEEVVVCISGLSLDKIVTAIYGDVTDEARYEYRTTVSTVIPSKTQEFIMQVTQLDLAAVRNLQKALGIYSSNALQFHQYHR